MNFLLRKATPNDVPQLRELIEASVRALQANDYTPTQIEAALYSVYGVDTQLIADGTYFAVEHLDEPAADHAEEHSRGSVGARHAVPAAAEYFQSSVTIPAIVACGGWSKRKTLYGGDQYARREDSLLDPARDAAKIRAFFVHPQWARRGIGTLILETCENAARAAGFTRLEMGATLSGVAFYRAKGYAALENLQVPLTNGELLPIVRMAKEIKPEF
jgi:GNAT superfamily N-acetyltransferase